MRILTLASIAILISCAPMHSQSNVLLLCDQQASTHCVTVTPGPSTSANRVFTLGDIFTVPTDLNVHGYTGLDEEALPALSTSGKARIVANSADHQLYASVNGGAYAVLGSGGGSGCTIGGPGTAKDILFITSGSCDTADSFQYDKTSGSLNVGFGLAHGSINIDAIADARNAQVHWTIGGSNGVSGAWGLGPVGTTNFSLIYGASALTFLNVKENGEIYVPYNSAASVAYFGSQNHQLSFSAGVVPIVTNGSFVSTTADTDASGLSFAAVASAGFVALSSIKTGSGTVLPMDFFVNPTRAMRIDTAGRILMGYTADAHLGYKLQVNGGIWASGGCDGCGANNVFDRTGSNFVNTIYQNTLNRTITVNAIIKCTASCAFGTADIEGDVGFASPPTNTAVYSNFSAVNQSITITFTVPPNYYYRIRNFGGTPNIVSWLEAL